MSATSSEFEIKVRTRGSSDSRVRVVEISYPATVEGDQAMADLLADLLEDVGRDGHHLGNDPLERGEIRGR